MIPYGKDYIESGNIFADETVLCLRCGTKIMGISYKEMPSVHNSKTTVNVACKMKYGNYRLLPVVLERKGKQSITNLPVCMECVKEVIPEQDSDKIISQISRGMRIEADYVGMPKEAVVGIADAWDGARILRKLNPQEMAEGRILQETFA